MTKIENTLSLALDELEWTGQKADWEKMKAVYEQNLYFVAFVGQFSAGKSYLINNLLGRDLLPRQLTETTPLLTYIRYGNEEKALLHAYDGSVQTLEVGQVRKLIQGNKELENQEYLEIFLTHGMLRQGMVILDTPGVNTLIQRHEQLLETSLALAAKVVYVSRNAPSKVDTQKLQLITEQGVPVTFVRTHCDNVQDYEETPKQMMDADDSILSRCGISSDNRYYLSNCPDSNWYSGVDLLRQMMISLGNNSAKELQASYESQCRTLAKQCLDALKEKEGVLSAVIDKDQQILDQKKQRIDRAVARLEDIIQTTEGELDKQIQRCENQLKPGGTIEQHAEIQMKESIRRIEKEGSNLTEDEMRSLLKEEAYNLMSSVQSDAEEAVEPLIGQINASISVEDLTSEPIPGINVNKYCDLVREQDAQYQQTVARLNTVRDNRAQLEQRLEEIRNSPEYELIQQQVLQLKAEIDEATNDLQDMGPYVARYDYVQDGDLQPSQIGRIIGEAADWALMFIPGEQVAAGITSVAGQLAKSKAVQKILVQILGNTSKVGAIFSNAGKEIRNGASVIDSVKDGAFALRHMSKTYNTQKRMAAAQKMVKNAGKSVAKSAVNFKNLHDISAQAESEIDGLGGLLDKLSIGYWAEAIGKNFDRMPKMVLDEQYEREYKQKEAELRQEIIQRQQRSHEKLRKMQWFETEQDCRKNEMEAAVVKEEKLQEELDRAEPEILCKAKKLAQEEWGRDCAAVFLKQAKEQMTLFLEHYRDELPGRLVDYKKQKILQTSKLLEKKRQELEEIQNTPSGEVKDTYDRVCQLIHDLEECVA